MKFKTFLIIIFLCVGYVNLIHEKGYKGMKNLTEEVYELYISLVSYEDLTKVDKKELFWKLVDYHKKEGILFPIIVSAQVIEETRSLTSDISKFNHNWYGMKCSTTCLCRGEKRGHAYFYNFKESTEAYKCWQKLRLKDNKWVKNSGDYLIMLKDFRIPGLCEHCQYATNPQYLRNLRRIITENKK